MKKLITSLKYFDFCQILWRGKYSEIGYNTTILLMKIRTSKLIKLSRKLEEEDKSYNSS